MTRSEATEARPKTLFLCGLKGCGKTTLAKEASLAAGCRHIDCDDQILRRNPKYKTCRDMFKAVGEKAFREEEERSVLSIIKQCKMEGKTAIVSLGGGACDASNVLEMAKDNGMLVYLHQEEHVLFMRMKEGGLPAYLDESMAETQFHELYLDRNEKYSCFADSVIQLSDCTKEEAVEELCRMLT